MSKKKTKDRNKGHDGLTYSVNLRALLNLLLSKTNRTTGKDALDSQQPKQILLPVKFSRHLAHTSIFFFPVEKTQDSAKNYQMFRDSDFVAPELFRKG